VAVDNGNSIRVGNGDLVRGDPDQLAVLCVCFVDSQVSATQTALI
jgi:hypothetical protein